MQLWKSSSRRPHLISIRLRCRQWTRPFYLLLRHFFMLRRPVDLMGRHLFASRTQQRERWVICRFLPDMRRLTFSNSLACHRSAMRPFSLTTALHPTRFPLSHRLAPILQVSALEHPFLAARFHSAGDPEASQFGRPIGLRVVVVFVSLFGFFIVSTNL